MDTYHIIPESDITEHEQSENCPCFPEIEKTKGVKIIRHNSFDGLTLTNTDIDLDHMSVKNVNRIIE